MSNVPKNRDLRIIQCKIWECVDHGYITFSEATRITAEIQKFKDIDRQ